MTIDARHIRVKSGGGLETDGDELVAEDVSGKVYRAAAQTISNNQITAVTFETESFDTDGMVDISGQPTRVTIQTTGKYQIGGSCRFGDSATGNRVVFIVKNGSDRVAAQAIGPNSGSSFGTNPYMSCGNVLELTAGDYLELNVWQDSSGDLDLLGGE